MELDLGLGLFALGSWLAVGPWSKGKESLARVEAMCR
jgi:hypothetical protein